MGRTWRRCGAARQPAPLGDADADAIPAGTPVGSRHPARAGSRRQRRQATARLDRDRHSGGRCARRASGAPGSQGRRPEAARATDPSTARASRNASDRVPGQPMSRHRPARPGRSGQSAGAGALDQTRDIQPELPPLAHSRALLIRQPCSCRSCSCARRDAASADPCDRPGRWPATRRRQHPCTRTLRRPGPCICVLRRLDPRNRAGNRACHALAGEEVSADQARMRHDASERLEQRGIGRRGIMPERAEGALIALARDVSIM